MPERCNRASMASMGSVGTSVAFFARIIRKVPPITASYSASARNNEGGGDAAYDAGQFAQRSERWLLAAGEARRTTGKTSTIVRGAGATVQPSLPRYLVGGVSVAIAMELAYFGE